MKERKIVFTLCFVGILINLIFTVFLHGGLILDVNNEINEEMYYESLRPSYFNNSMSPIYINDSDTNYDWNWAESQPWCKNIAGVYYIENLTINGMNSSNCITIINSNKPFIINNCTLFNATSTLDYGAIMLWNVSNGIVINNNCSYQAVGIGLYGHQNIISGNICDNNLAFGIAVADIYDRVGNDNIIEGNVLINNSIGMVIGTNNNSEILNNIISGNNNSGIWLSSTNYSRVFGNRLVNNGIGSSTNQGIQLEGACIKNQIYDNLIQENSKGVLIKVGSSENEVFSNAFIKNGIHAEDNGIDTNWTGHTRGNYWDNHTYADPDHNGIINTVFNTIAGSNNLAIDYLPLWQSPIHIGGIIHIDETSGSAPNWSRTANLTNWCSGSGSFSDPYLIENLEIDANYTRSCILIGNSTTGFVKIENCILLNANSSESDSGILVDNSDNITIVDNICLNNANFGIFFGGGCKNNTILLNFIEGNSTNTGIFLADGCNNNTILNNTITSTGNDTTSIGIFLFEYCYDNKILENTIITNRGIGISLAIHCSNNTILRNEVSNNNLHGISLFDKCNDNSIVGNIIFENENGIILNGACNNNSISGNTASNNRDSGIKLMDSCVNNTISGNTAEFNGQNGIHLFYCNNNTISNNDLSFNYNGIRGIYLEESDYNEIVSNTASYNDYGIVLVNSNYNSIRNNDFKNNRINWRSLVGNCTGNIFTDNEIYAPYGPSIPPYYIGIIIIIIICSIVIALGGMYAYKRKQKVITVQPKGVPGKKSYGTSINEQAVRVKKKKQKVDESAPVSLDLTEIEKEEIKQTESELGIEKSVFICIVHKGTIDGAVYICPNCKTFYCVRCANALKEKGEKCWSCESDISVSITDNVISENEQKIQELQSRIESIKTTVQTLDESFYSGAISQDIYSQSREPLMKKITALIEEIEQLKKVK